MTFDGRRIELSVGGQYDVDISKGAWWGVGPRARCEPADASQSRVLKRGPRFREALVRWSRLLSPPFFRRLDDAHFHANVGQQVCCDKDRGHHPKRAKRQNLRLCEQRRQHHADDRARYCKSFSRPAKSTGTHSRPLENAAPWPASLQDRISFVERNMIKSLQPEILYETDRSLF